MLKLEPNSGVCISTRGDLPSIYDQWMRQHLMARDLSAQAQKTISYLLKFRKVKEQS